MHDAQRMSNHIHKDLLLQFMQKVEHAAWSIPPFHGKVDGFFFLCCGMVENDFGLVWRDEKVENQI
jgi:hypothetical protein